MTVSVIIPTYNGAHRIERLLPSLAEQTHTPDEIIVVVDGSTDGTTLLLRSRDWGLPQLRIIEQANAGRAGVRNRGAAEATCELLIFVDDDQIADSEFVAAHLEHHRSFEQSIGTGRQEPTDTRRQTDIGRFRLWLQHQWTKDWRDVSQRSQLLHNSYITGANLSLPRDLFLRLDGFDARLRDCEDADLARRAERQEINLYHLSCALTLDNDNDQETFSAIVRRQRQYWHAQQKLVELGLASRLSKTPRSRWKQWIMRLLRASIWTHSVEGGWWTWLPADLRYRLYRLVLTAHLN